MIYSTYYQANVLRNQTWFFVAILRSFENMAFDRALDKQEGLFEFFVSPGLEQEFIALMDYFKGIAIVTNIKKLPNRLSDGTNL